MFLSLSFLNAVEDVALIAGMTSHPYHVHFSWSRMSSKCINAVKMGIFRIIVTDDCFPKNPSIFEDDDFIVLKCDGGGRYLIR